MNKYDPARLTGITEEAVQCVGTTNLQLSIDTQILNNKFFIVEDDFPIPTDGIIGRDILTKYICKIDFETFTITFNINGNEFILPMNTRPVCQVSKILPARSEIIFPIDINIKEDSLVLNKELAHGVFLASCLIPAHGVAHVKILNTTDKTIEIDKIDCEVHPLKDYNICYGKKSEPENKDRLEALLNELYIGATDPYAISSITNICKEFNDIFHLSEEKLSVNNFYTQEIQTTDTSPVYIKNYRLPQTQMAEINEQVEQLLENDIIEHSVSPYNSPLLVVPKKSTDNTKKWRLVVDFRRLNEKIVSDKFPLTRIEDVLDRLGRAKYFSTLDMTSSFHQINLQENSRPLTAFSTGNGHFQFKRLPFGLKISSNSFQRMLTIALSGLDAAAFLYVDDIIVFGCSLNHHNDNLINVFQRLRKFNLKLNVGKCCFLKPEVVYLGHLITDKGIKTDPAKNEIIRNYPVPTNADESRRFVAFCNYYRRFIPKFAEITKCINDLQKKDKTFIWSTECQNAFESLKNQLLRPPILKYPDFTKNFILTTDASNYALGAVLSQGDIGLDLPISYASTTLSKHDINKPIIEKELLAIHWGINFFRPYLYGRKFVVVTDHRPLVSLFSHRNPSSKMTRIRMDLCDYDFDIVYKKGKMNTNADALSRINLNSETLKTMIPSKDEEKVLAITRSMQNKAKDHDSDIINKCAVNKKPDHLFIWDCTSMTDIKNIHRLKFITQRNSKKITIQNINNDIIVRCSDNPSNTKVTLEKLTSRMRDQKIRELALSKSDYMFNSMAIDEFKILHNEIQKENNYELKILLYSEPERINCKHTQLKLISEYHDSTHGGHLGIRKTTMKLKQRYIWKNMYRMTKQYILNCPQCRINKQTKHTKEPFTLTDTPGTSFEVVSIDTVGPLRLSNHFRYILTIQCDLTKYIVAYPMETKDARTVAKTLVENFILIYGNFKILKSDKGTEFTNQLMSEMCGLLRIKQIFSAPYHHETLGSLERNHRVLNEFLLNFSKNDEWDSWIPYFTFAYNTTPHIDTNYSPYELVFGKLPYLPNDQLNSQKPFYNSEDYVTELKHRLKFSLEKAKELLEKSKIKRILKENKTNPIQLMVGDLVLLRVIDRKKNQAPYKGPYKIISREGVNSKLEINGQIKKYHNNMLKKWNLNDNVN